MSKEDNIELQGVVIDLLPESRCMVQLENGHKVLCYTAGKLKKFKIYSSEQQNHGLENVLDTKIISKSKKSIEGKDKASLKFNIVNTDRSVGAMLSGKIAKLYGHKGLPKGCLLYTSDAADE